MRSAVLQPVYCQEERRYLIQPGNAKVAGAQYLARIIGILTLLARHIHPNDCHAESWGRMGARRYARRTRCNVKLDSALFAPLISLAYDKNVLMVDGRVTDALLPLRTSIIRKQVYRMTTGWHTVIIAAVDPSSMLYTYLRQPDNVALQISVAERSNCKAYKLQLQRGRRGVRRQNRNSLLVFWAPIHC